MIAISFSTTVHPKMYSLIALHDIESGVGTRKSGEKIRNELINIYKQSSKNITLDFVNINIISSSFADELMGKLVTEFGFYGFNNIFKLKNMNSNVQSIVQRSVAQRMMESFNGKGEDKLDYTSSDDSNLLLTGSYPPSAFEIDISLS